MCRRTLFEISVLARRLCKVCRISEFLAMCHRRVWLLVAILAESIEVSNHVSEMYRGVSFEVRVIVCSSPTTSAVGADEFDSQPEANASVTCLSEAFLDRDVHFENKDLGHPPDLRYSKCCVKNTWIQCLVNAYNGMALTTTNAPIHYIVTNA